MVCVPDKYCVTTQIEERVCVCLKANQRKIISKRKVSLHFIQLFQLPLCIRTYDNVSNAKSVLSSNI